MSAYSVKWTDLTGNPVEVASHKDLSSCLVLIDFLEKHKFFFKKELWIYDLKKHKVIFQDGIFNDSDNRIRG